MLIKSLENILFILKKMNKKEIIIVRNLLVTDLPFIYSTWLQGLYNGNHWFNQIKKHSFYTNYHKIIESLIEHKPSVIVNVAALKEDPDVIISYAVLDKIDDKTILHWVFTKKAFRRMGIAKMILDPKITHVTHLTNLGKNIKPREWDFDPFLT